MLGLLLALTLSQHPVTCTVVNLAPPSVVCGEGRDRVEFRDIDWPAQWGKGAILTGKYEAQVVEGKLVPIRALQDYDEFNARVRARSLAEGRRWRARY
jgi:hypothetical protein